MNFITHRAPNTPLGFRYNDGERNKKYSSLYEQISSVKSQNTNKYIKNNIPHFKTGNRNIRKLPAAPKLVRTSIQTENRIVSRGVVYS